MAAASPDQRSGTQLWLDHAGLPLVLFVSMAGVFVTTRLDLAIARALFFDVAGHGWIGAHNWLVNQLIHTDGRWAVRVIALLALVVWAASLCSGTLREWRRPVGYFLSALVLTIGIVGLLKTVTNVDCPWDLRDFGGRFPYVELFSSRPPEFPPARCFPAAHASSGYAFMALYFLARERSVALARLGLVVGLVLGAIFGIAQQSRGAHFVSHDLWSAFLAWMISLSLYAFAFRGRLYSRLQCVPDSSSQQRSQHGCDNTPSDDHKRGCSQSGQQHESDQRDADVR